MAGETLDKPAAEAADPVTPPVASSHEPQSPSEDITAAPVVAAPAPPSGSSMPVVGGAVAGAIFGILSTLGYHNFREPPVTVADPRIAQIEATIAAVDKRAAAVADLEQRLGAQVKAAEARAASAEQKAAALEQKTAEAQQLAAQFVAPVDDRLKSVESKLGEAAEQAQSLTRQVEGLAKAPAPKVDLSPLAAKIETIEKAVGSAAARASEGGTAAAQLDGRLKAMEQTVASLQSRKPVVDTSGSVLAIAGLARAALDAGAPLGPQVKALSGLGVAEADIRPLLVFADTPVPGYAALADQLVALGKTLPKPKAEPVAAEGWFGKVKSGLSSIVEVRQTGRIPMDAESVVGRAWAKLYGKDSAGALAELSGLTADQQAILKPVVETIKAREAANAALKKLEGDALAAASRKG